jgi:hypothetical protein
MYYPITIIITDPCIHGKYNVILYSPNITGAWASEQANAKVRRIRFVCDLLSGPKQRGSFSNREFLHYMLGLFALSLLTTIKPVAAPLSSPSEQWADTSRPLSVAINRDPYLD